MQIANRKSQIANRKSQIIKTFSLAAICSSVLFISGCSSFQGCNIQGSIESTNGGKPTSKVSGGCSWGGNQQTMNLFESLAHKLYAFTGYSVYSFDFSVLAIDYSVSNGYVPNQNGVIKIRLLNNSTVIAEQSFDVVVQSGQAKLADPQRVQQWASTYDGLINSVDYSLNSRLETGSGTVSVTHTSRNGTDILASATTSTVIKDDCWNCAIQ